MSRVAGTTFAQAEGPPVERELAPGPPRQAEGYLQFTTTSLPPEDGWVVDRTRETIGLPAHLKVTSTQRFRRTVKSITPPPPPPLASLTDLLVHLCLTILVSSLRTYLTLTFAPYCAGNGGGGGGELCQTFSNFYAPACNFSLRRARQEKFPALLRGYRPQLQELCPQGFALSTT